MSIKQTRIIQDTQNIDEKKTKNNNNTLKHTPKKQNISKTSTTKQTHEQNTTNKQTNQKQNPPNGKRKQHKQQAIE